MVYRYFISVSFNGIFSVIAPYKALFDETRWDTLIEQFRQENYRLFQLASQSVFTVALQTGLSALKTPYPFQKIAFICFSCFIYFPLSGSYRDIKF